MARFDDIISAHKEWLNKYADYEEECTRFVCQLRTKLTEAFGCPVGCIRFADESEEAYKLKSIKELSRCGKLALQKDAFYQFILHVQLDPRPLYIRLRVKKADNYFIVKSGSGKKRIWCGKREELDTLITALFKTIKKFIEKDFKRFIQGGSWYTKLWRWITKAFRQLYPIVGKELFGCCITTSLLTTTFTPSSVLQRCIQWLKYALGFA